MGSTALDQNQSSPPTTEEGLGASGRNSQAPARFTAQYSTSTCCPAAFRLSQYEDVGQQGRETAQPPSSSPGVGRHLRASWVLINANYIGVVINLGTQVLADENKTIPFFAVRVPAAIIKEPQLRIMWVRTLDWEGGIKVALFFGVYVCVSQ